MTVPKWKSLLGKIVWLEDPLKYTYLRETIHHADSSAFPAKKKIKGYQEKIVGYELISHTPGEIFVFRFWWLKTYDRDIAPEDVYKNQQPHEAVVPSSIAAGEKSLHYQTPDVISP